MPALPTLRSLLDHLLTLLPTQPVTAVIGCKVFANFDLDFDLDFDFEEEASGWVARLAVCPGSPEKATAQALADVAAYALRSLPGDVPLALVGEQGECHPLTAQGSELRPC